MMTMKLRNKKIIELAKTLSYQEIGNQFNLSSERIRQIVSFRLAKAETFQICKIHNKRYDFSCAFCDVVNGYQKMLEIANGIFIKGEIDTLSGKARHPQIIWKRAALIKYLKTKGLNFTQIARLLKRDRASIMHLYNKKL